MRKIIIPIFLVLTFLCSTAMSETAVDWSHKASLLWEGTKFTNPKKAIEYLSNAIKLKPDYTDAYIFRGFSYSELGQYQRAITDYNQAIRLKPDYTDAYVKRGVAYGKLSQYQSAIDDFNEAIRLKPDYASAYNNRGLAYLMQGNNKLGCPDAQKGCELGSCKTLELAKRKGNCR